MTGSAVRIGIAGCGFAARIHLDRLLALPQIRVVGFADPEMAAARQLADRVPVPAGEPTVGTFTDHRELLRQLQPDALAIFTPHLAHYRPAMDALQAGCHVFIEKPLSTNAQEAADIVGLARARQLKVGVGHQYRLRPSLVEARRRLEAGAIGPVRLVTAVLAQPWLAAHSGAEHSWRFDPKVASGGILADAGDHLVDTLLWTTRQAAVEVATLQTRHESGLDLVTAAAVGLADGTPATLAITGVSASTLFELTFFGERGRLQATDESLFEDPGGPAALPEPSESIDGNFVSAVLTDTSLCCPADQALETVRLLDALARSAAARQSVRLA
jgi:predicted dehydrogenase